MTTRSGSRRASSSRRGTSRSTSRGQSSRSSSPGSRPPERAYNMSYRTRNERGDQDWQRRDGRSGGDTYRHDERYDSPRSSDQFRAQERGYGYGQDYFEEGYRGRERRERGEHESRREYYRRQPWYEDEDMYDERDTEERRPMRLHPDDFDEDYDFEDEMEDRSSRQQHHHR